jgi:hypothetical protein
MNAPAAFPSRRQRRAAKLERPFPGTAQCCPKCKSGRVVVHDTSAFSELKFYGRRIATCADCRTAWEPVDDSLVWDRSDPCASLSAPCDNCAFRPGSPEQADTAEWKKMIASLRAGASFHCHKGVPIEPGSEHGFAYPRDDAGKPHKGKLRLCRGYLTALFAASTARYRLLAAGATRWAARAPKLRVGLTTAQHFAFAALSAFRSVIHCSLWGLWW